MTNHFENGKIRALEYIKNAKDPWRTKVKLTPEQKKALERYRFCEREEDRLGGSVFANPFNMRQQQAKTKEAYEACVRLGMGVEHGL